MFEKVKKVGSKLIYAVPVAVFLVFVFYIMAMTYTEEKPGMVRKVIAETQFNFDSYVDLSNRLEEVLQKNIYEKYRFINLNGRIAKYLRFNSLNHVQKLANGYLTGFHTAIDITENSVNIIELNRFLSERGIPFLFIAAPSKNSMYDVKFAPGYSSDARKTLIEMVNTLREAGINTLDMDSWFEEHHWHMEDVFFKTDHHWRPKAGLMAAQQTMELLQQKEIAVYEEEKLQEKNYRIKVLKNWLLGYQGRRVGKQYAGVDDIAVYYPRFKTRYSYSGLHRNSTDWDYKKNLLRQDLIKEKNLFRADPQAIYLYGELPLQIVTNTDAINNMRLLVIGDSFRKPWQYFLATQFQEMHSLDPMRFSDWTTAQYIEEIKPDLVIVILDTSRFGYERYFDFGIKEYEQALAETNHDEPGILLGDFEISAQESNNNNFVTFGINLESGQTYTLTVDNTEVLKGKPRHIQITLIDQTTNNPITNHYFEARRTDKQKWIFTVPDEPDNYDLYLYAGTKKHTARNSIKVSNMVLRKGIIEE